VLRGCRSADVAMLPATNVGVPHSALRLAYKTRATPSFAQVSAGRAFSSRRRPGVKTRCSKASDEELGKLATSDAEAFLFESGRGGRRIDAEQLTAKESWEAAEEARYQAKLEKQRVEAEEKGWDQTKDGWKFAKSRGWLQDMKDLVGGLTGGVVGS